MLGTIARAGKHLIYPSRDDETQAHGYGLVIEHESLGELTVADVPFYIRLDLMNLRDYYLDGEGTRRRLDCAEVNDWKTTGDIARRAKTGRELVQTYQMPVYAAWALKLLPVGKVRLSHTYFGTVRREAQKSTALITEAEVADRMGGIAATVERMKQAATATHAIELEPNWDVCHKTRKGCYYLPICPRGQGRSLADMFGDKVGAMLEGLAPPASSDHNESQEATTMAFDLNQFLTATKAPTPAAPAVESAPATPAPAPAIAPGMSAPTPVAGSPASTMTPEQKEAAIRAMVAEKMRELGMSSEGAPAATPPVAQILGASPGAGLAGNGANGAAVVSTPEQVAAFPPLPVVPPDAPVSGTSAPKAEPIPAEVLVTMSPAIQQAHAATFAAAPAASGNPAATFAPDASVAAALEAQAAMVAPVTRVQSIEAEGTVMVPPAAPKKRGRPPKASTVASATGQVSLGTPPAGGITIFVDVLIDGLEYASLDDYIDATATQLAADLGLADIRLAPDGHAMAYGKWKAAFEMCVRNYPPAPGVYATFSDASEIKAVALGELRKLATAYVRGVR